MKKEIIIEKVDLLSQAMYHKYIDHIRKIDMEWWLKTPANRSIRRVATVLDIDKMRNGVISSEDIIACAGVRPVLRLRVEEHVLMPGDSITLCGVDWTVFKVSKNRVYVLANDIVAMRKFDSTYSAWDVSDLKKWLEEWVEYIVAGLDDVMYITETE